VLGLLVGLSACSACDDQTKKPTEAAPKPAELKVLDRLIGMWKDEATFKVSEWTSKEKQETYIYRNEWTLNSRFVQSRGRSFDGDAEDLQIITFDAEKKTFRRWYFDSEGTINESTGTWDDTSRTLTWTGDLGDGITAVSVWTVADEKTLVWSRTAKDKKGKVYVDIDGKAIRQE
jgi:hypothetical protein